MAYYRSSGSNSSRTNFPVGAVKQVASHEYHGGNSDALTGTATLTRVESGSNSYYWAHVIYDVLATNWVGVHMTFSWYLQESSAADVGAAFGIARADGTEIYHPTGGNAHVGLYFYDVDSSNQKQMYMTQNHHFIDKSPLAGTNFYYLTYAVHGQSNLTVQSDSTLNPFVCTLTEIQQ